MEFVSWNPIRMIRRYRERRERRSITVKIYHPRTRIEGVIVTCTLDPSLNLYVAFLGIPYALIPNGKLRFQPPKALPQRPPHHFTPLFLAYKGSYPCTQRDENDEIVGTEDCLYLNIYTPRKPKDIPELLPVLVYIHGGGFTLGENIKIDPQNVTAEDVIVVSINYRLGIFGFLNMRTENCLGNAGMKDQVMALKWIQNNIKQFKGNPNNVTICGESAGGSCVNFHMLSPLSKGLFHKAIVMAGGVHCPWGFGGHAKHVKQIFKNATPMSNDFKQSVVDILKNEKATNLMKLGEDTMRAYLFELEPKKMTALYKPSVEFVEKDAFLPDTVEKLMEVAEPVPTIAGISKQEGYHYFPTHVSDVIDLMNGDIKFVELVKDILRQNFSWKDPMAVEKHLEFFKTKYFPEEWMLDEGENEEEEENKLLTMTEEEKLRKEEEKNRKEDEQKQRLATLFTDIIFRRFYDNFKIGNLLNEGEPPLYVYEFDYFAGQPLFPIPTSTDIRHYGQPLINARAADHTDDFFFLFCPVYVYTVLDRIPNADNERVQLEIESVQTHMSSLWSSFCRTGHPESRAVGDANVNWERHTEQAPRYLRISEKLTLMYGRLNGGRWPELNALCQLESTISSLAVTPQTPEKECEVSQLSQYEPDQSTSQTWVEEVESLIANL